MNALPALDARASGSVFGRLRLFFMVVFTVGGVGALALAWVFWNTAANAAYDRLLISAAVQIAETIDIEQARFVVQPPDAAFQTLALAEGDRLFYAVRDPAGVLLTGDAELTSDRRTNEPEKLRLDTARFAGVSVRTVTVGRFLSGPGGEGWCNVIVAQTRDARNAFAISLMAKTGILIVVVAALGYIGSVAAIRRAFLPLARIEQVLDSRQPDDMTPLQVESPRETQALVNTINKVMARLANRMIKLETFTAVAAHQIRTPLAALTSQVELLAEDRTDEDRRTRITRIRDRVMQLGRLTHQLLGHAMIMYRSDSRPYQQVDLVELARNALYEGVPLSLERDLGMMLEAPDAPVIVMGDPVVLAEGLTNLVNNAVTHGTHSTLNVRVGVAGDEAFVAVFDDGPGIPKELWETAVLPFTVARGARGGAGLGLSIASDIARAHGGRMEFALPEGGGFEVRMILRRAANRETA
jgi:two-component system sensor histidine kinase TctE